MREPDPTRVAIWSNGRSEAADVGGRHKGTRSLPHRAESGQRIKAAYNAWRAD
jgi:hypothetical protein